MPRVRQTGSVLVVVGRRGRDLDTPYVVSRKLENVTRACSHVSGLVRGATAHTRAPGGYAGGVLHRRWRRGREGKVRLETLLAWCY